MEGFRAIADGYRSIFYSWGNVFHPKKVEKKTYDMLINEIDEAIAEAWLTVGDDMRVAMGLKRIADENRDKDSRRK